MLEKRQIEARDPKEVLRDPEGSREEVARHDIPHRMRRRPASRPQFAASAPGGTVAKGFQDVMPLVDHRWGR